MNKKTIIIDGVEYVKKSEVKKMAINTDGMPYVIIRTYSAGVHAGYLAKKDGLEVTLINSRRIWSWSGAASLSELAMKGTSNPDNCKFPCEVDKIQLQWIEIIDCTEKAMNSIKEVKIWSK